MKSKEIHQCARRGANESQDFMNLAHERAEREKDRDWREMAEINVPGGIGSSAVGTLADWGKQTQSVTVQ